MAKVALHAQAADQPAGRPRALATIDLAAISANVVRLKEVAAGAEVMAVVKDNGYGHGAVESARASLSGGANWLGVATVDEALQLRSAGLDVPIVLLLTSASDRLTDAVAADVDVTVGSRRMLADVASAAVTAGRSARIHLEVDTGMGRGGAPASDWAGLVRGAARAEANGDVHVVGVWSHLACADIENHPSISPQVSRFADAVRIAESEGLRPEVRHLANSAATFGLPQTRFDLVRPGLSLFGVSPADHLGPESELGLRPAMTLTSVVASTKLVAAGQGVSYGLEYETARDSRLAVVPIGYSDGVPRTGSNALTVALAGRRYQAAGRICMDQFVVDLGQDWVDTGDEVFIFGTGEHGEATVREFAKSCGTIANEVLTRIGARVAYRYCD